MKKTAFLFLCASTLFTTLATAQNEVDAIRFSRTFHSGTARFSAMGGAFTALGGDPATLAFNPAGIGVYRAGEFTITPDLAYSNTASSFMGSRVDDDRYQLGLSNVGGIGVMNLSQSEGLVSLNVGISSNRYNTFSGRTIVQGSPVEGGSSYRAYFASLANRWDITNKDNKYDIEREQDLAWHTGLIDYDMVGIKNPNTQEADTLYGYRPYLNLNEPSEARRFTETWGSIREFDLSIGGNYSHVFYFGFTVGIQSISYSNDLTDEDENLSANSPEYQGFTYNKTYRTSGTGYNLKFGFIARPFAYADFLNGLRVGAAVHTPTFFNIGDEYSSTIDARFSTAPKHMDASYNGGEFRYALQTPYKCMAGAAYTFGGQGSQWRGIVSADYEYLDYSKMKMRPNGGSNGYSFVDENRAINTYFKSAHNLRFGGELGVGSVALRGGYALYASPYTGSAGKKGAAQIYSGGIGYRGDSHFIDFTFSHLAQQDNEYLYNSAGRACDNEVVKSEEISYDIRQSSFMITFGLRF